MICRHFHVVHHPFLAMIKMEELRRSLRGVGEA